MPIIIDDPKDLAKWGLDGPEQKELRAFSNGVETVIAFDEADATACLCEVTGYGPDELEFSGPWEEISSHKYLDIRTDELISYIYKAGKELPALNIPKDFTVSINARITEWIAVVGRNVLCSTEW